MENRKERKTYVTGVLVMFALSLIGIAIVFDMLDIRLINLWFTSIIPLTLSLLVTFGIKNKE